MPEWIQQHALVWTDMMQQSAFWWQLIVLGLAVTTALAMRQWIKRIPESHHHTDQQNRLRTISWHTLERIQFPISMLLVTLVGQAILHAAGLPSSILIVATPLLLSLAGIRIAVYLLRKVFTPGPLIKAWENVIASVIWCMVALHLLGWLPDVLSALDTLAFRLGDNRISLLLAIKLCLTVVFFWILALWIANIIEQQLHRSPHISSSAQVALSKFSKFFLIALAILIALDAAGIDLTALTVFSGAVGVGIGFGLQRISSNFISGFILLFDRSIKPGDVITVRDKFGWVQELRARYIVVRDRDGVETLIPNENLVTSEVINWSYSDPNVRIKIRIQISYDDDPEQAMQLMLECARASARVLLTPEPLCRLIEFADNGIVLELRIWIADPEKGLGGVRSEVNLAIWRAFKQHGITIPYPQRDIHIKEGGKLQLSQE
ncbi:mechanosensitive ion channel [Mariprofundus erugo]|uniref:Mechanosensitive ion channel n=2 Tax=Mariprofundus erugo TaxID=2528639 RepID=A0A5R9GPP0_9PROT|nr:mechanosensitive ion channel domain-containing protein [Mariprofundus erugo]TLS67568.1 mechanosensitive ion channel [Mariprofundus erugo]TLS76252.1 mechanosensitive ion channel [Mariprofundus erugo]